MIGLLAIVARGIPWYRKHGKRRDFMPLGPFLWMMLEGVLASLATGGLMGKAAYAISAGSNTLGDQMLSSLAGANGPGVNRTGIDMLTPGGAVLLVLVLLGCLIWFWKASWTVRLQMALGLIAGVTLGPTAGIAGVAGVVVSPIFNTFGGWLVGSA